ncbi:polysaccharide pyruvyl transferase family protein [Sulfitobacter sp. AS59]|uniref:polysaccharide pyruvyl transferase family protein n=1 Tax=Sulfitobacter sp. AS59 TaxID=3135784 RepID=UPI00317F975A
MKKRVLIWGFYDQGNLGDDLMALMFAELVKQSGATPVICSQNIELSKYGYEISDDPFNAKMDIIFLGGGAFFKKRSSSKSVIEDKVLKLADYLDGNPVPIYGLSLGGDGIDQIDQASPNRQRIISSKGFRGSTVRLRKNLNLGPSNLTFLPDIVLCTAHFCHEIMGWEVPDENTPRLGALLNFSRRSFTSFLKILLRTRGSQIALFQAHASKSASGGELSLPGVKNYRADNIRSALSVIAASEVIYSSKLHPGIIALSFGVPFHPIGSRPKTMDFFKDFDLEDFKVNPQYFQSDLWSKYLDQVSFILRYR